MLNVLGPRSWIFWWAGLTALAFLQDLLTSLADFFKSQSLFTRDIPPFSLIPGLNGWIDTAAVWLQTNVQFDANKPLAQLGPIGIPNWSIALLVGILILVIALLLYRKALATSSLLDDFGALFALYFVIRIEAHLLSIAKIPAIGPAAQSVLGNQLFSFGVVMLFLLGLAVTGEGLKSTRSFWRALAEVLIVAILLFPTEAGTWVANGILTLNEFGSNLRNNLVLGAAWGLIGLILAVQRLYYGDAKPAKE